MISTVAARDKCLRKWRPKRELDGLVLQHIKVFERQILAGQDVDQLGAVRACWTIGRAPHNEENAILREQLRPRAAGAAVVETIVQLPTAQC